jgi:zinc D-Ala-D-Ala dipeptidase
MEKSKNKFILILLIGGIFLFFSCIQQSPTVNKVYSYSIIYINQKVKKDTSKMLSLFEIKLLKNDFIDIHTIDSSIVCDLRYSSTNNFVGLDMYKDFNKCYLPKDIAQRLSLAQKKLQTIDSNYSLLILDASRPLSIQKIMWDSCAYNSLKKKKFLAQPSQTSLHNYGAAVDVSLRYKGKEVDMGTPYDFAGEAAYTYNEQKLVACHTISLEQMQSRQLLRKVMMEEGFIENRYEWWHFGATYRSKADNLYPLIVSFDSICPVRKNLE